MGKFKTALRLFICNPRQFITALARNNFLNWIRDEKYLKIRFYCEIGTRANLKDPLTFNEKLQWLKLHDRKPEYTTYVDKYAVREHIKNTIGEQYLIPLIGVYNDVKEIPWDELPEKFVLKCTHGSQSNIICTDKNTLDINKSMEQLEKWMKRNWYWFSREWPYKEIKPRIVCEKFIEDAPGVQLKDYKFYCFNGEPKIIQVVSERNGSNYYLNHFDLNWNEVEITRKSIMKKPGKLDRPNNLEKMIEISRILSRGMPFARIDLYETKTVIYFGEITFFPVSGFIDFADSKTDYLLGSWIDLTEGIGLQSIKKEGFKCKS